ncbi:enoyl-CoA hydratase/isomerase family protein [Halomonas sabkhae]|uniref:enoyl-CoA hydratase/isomerase family protein n=1 Tax=Halomonas sabkhae TaxID=626223 RepID=UPI0025B5D6A0|nr:enoyl-CoA hydratase/isomerase family protein [Halomonas sabkhae]MDN3526580.1 enoyl-CoA hydratase/isomerase family protein [Halomonas sabkhae]
MSEALVHFEEWPTRGGERLGLARLNAPKALNALSLEMIRLLNEQLDAWEQDDAVVAIWLEGAGGKAFCAGGDVVALYRSLQEDSRADFAETYFAAEYALDHRLHTCPKPLLVWGDGIIMGGGVGLMAGGFQRLVTETSLMAMPEITIGLYPDVGASWLLARLPRGIGAYLGLTGAQLNARDMLDLGLADRFVPRDRRDALLAALTEADYGARDMAGCRGAVIEAVASVEDRRQAPQGRVMAQRDHVQSLTDRGTVSEAVTQVLNDDSEDAWLAANRQRLATGCPMTAHLVWRMLERHRHSSLAEAFRDELGVSVQVSHHGDVGEGVRALLVDKDKQPRWSHADVASVPPADVEALLRSPWDDADHPLKDLG